MHGEQGPKPRRGEAVAPAPVGVPVGQGVARRRSANPAIGSRKGGGLSCPLGGVVQYESPRSGMSVSRFTVSMFLLIERMGHFLRLIGTLFAVVLGHFLRLGG